jgi:hypothetical protein
MKHYKTFLPFMEQEVRSQCYFDDKGHVKKTEAKELDEEMSRRRSWMRGEGGGEGGEEGVGGGSLPGHACWRSQTSSFS